MKSLITYIKFGIPGIVAGVFIATGVQLVFAWTAPAGAPPSNNTPAPINVSATNQTKTGSLTLGVSVLSPIFYDSNDTSYYTDPNGVSSLNDIRPNIMYDRQNIGYYVDPNSSSRFNYGVYDNLYSNGWMQTPIFYDANDNGYYVDPNSTTFLYNIYSNNWAQFNSGTVGYAAGFYGAGWSHNAQPQNANGSIYTNDVYLRSIGKWASQLTKPNCRIQTTEFQQHAGPGAVVTGQTGVNCSESGSCWTPIYSWIVCD